MSESDLSPAERVAAEVFQVWNTHRADEFGALFPAQARYVDVLAQVAVGPEEIAELHRLPFDRIFPRAVLAATDLTSRLLRDDVVSIDAGWTMTGHLSLAGAGLPKREGSMHLVVQRLDARWWPVVVHNYDYSNVYQRTSAGGNPLTDGPVLYAGTDGSPR